MLSKCRTIVMKTMTRYESMHDESYVALHDNTSYTSSLLIGSYPPPFFDIASLRRYAGHPIYQPPYLMSMNMNMNMKMKLKVKTENGPSSGTSYTCVQSTSPPGLQKSAQFYN